MSGSAASAPVPRVRVGAILRQDDTILLVQHEKDGHAYWLLPGGGVDFGETLTAALRREVWEETGFATIIGDIALVHDSIPPDKHRHIVNICFWGEIRGGTLSKGDDPRLRDVRFVPIGELAGLDMVPDLGLPLARVLETPDTTGPVYLGTIWRELP